MICNLFAEKALSKLSKYGDKQKNTFNVIGTEIRLKRDDLDMTLKAISGDICSVSYLSKVEHNKIEPNMAILKEICERLDITEKQFNEILNSDDRSNEMIEAYVKGNSVEMKRIFEDNKNLKNYRSVIICSFYLLYIEDFKSYERNFNKIKKAIDVFNDEDSVLFSLMLAIYLYKTNDYMQCIRILNKLEDLCKDDYSIVLVKKLYLYILYKLNSSMYYNKNKEYKEIIWNMYNVEDYINVQAKEIRFNYNKKVCDILVPLPWDVKTCLNYMDIIIKEGKQVYQNSKLFDLLQVYLTSKEDFLEACKGEVYYENSLEANLIEYLKLSVTNYDKSIDYLHNVAMPLAYSKNDYMYSFVFTKLLQRHYSNNTRYKRILELEALFNNHFGFKAELDK